MTSSRSSKGWPASAACLASLALSSLIAGCASGPSVVANPNVPPLMASQAIPGQIKFTSIDDKQVNLCNGCPQELTNQDYFRGLFRQSLQNHLPVRVSNLLANGKALDQSAHHPMEMRAKLQQFQVELGFGIAKIYMLTAYELMENKEVVASWVVPSYGVSDALATQDNTYEAMLSAINNNATSLYLRFITDSSPKDSAQASKELAAIDSRMQEDMKKSGNPVWGALGWTAVTLVKGAQSVGKALDSAGASYARYCQDNASECARNRGATGAEANMATMNRLSAMTQFNVDQINANNQRLSDAAAIRKDTEAKARAEQLAYRKDLARSNATSIPITSVTPSSSKQEPARTSTASTSSAIRGSTQTSSSSPSSASSSNTSVAQAGTSSQSGGSSSDKSAKPVGRKRLTYPFFVAQGVMRATAELTMTDALAQAKKDAVAYLASLGNGRYHATFIDYKKVRCDQMGGNPLYQRCIISFDYEVDDID